MEKPETVDQKKSPYEVIENVERERGLRRGTILEKNRSEYVHRARLEVISRLHKMGLGPAEIGRILQRDHSTIIVALGKLKQLENGKI